MSRGTKISNEYARVLQPRYGSTPKAVIAAVAVSLLLKENQGNWGNVYDSFVKEWATLHANGIVEQKPLITSKSQEPKQWRQLGPEHDQYIDAQTTRAFVK